MAKITLKDEINGYKLLTANNLRDYGSSTGYKAKLGLKQSDKMEMKVLLSSMGSDLSHVKATKAV